MKSISTEELRGKLERDEDILMINTLSADGFKQTHIPDSVNIPQDREDFMTKVVEAAGSKDKTVIVYCASKECSSSTEAARKLEDAGFAKVYDYEGGAKSWNEAGEKLVAGA